MRFTKSADGLSSLWASMACCRLAVANPSRHVTTPFFWVSDELLGTQSGSTRLGATTSYGAVRAALTRSMEKSTRGMCSVRLCGVMSRNAPTAARQTRSANA